MPVVIQSGATNTDKAVVLYRSAVTIAQITSSSSAAGYPAVNMLEDATFSAYQPSSTTGNVVFDAGVAVTVDSIGIGAHTLATTGSSVTLQHSSDGTTWTDAHTTYAALSDEDVLILFPAVTARYWRLATRLGIPNIGVVRFGQKLAMPHPPIDSYTPLHHARRYEKMFNDSIKGVMLGNRVMASGAETTVDFGFVERAYVDGALRPFESHYNQGGTFFYAGWPAGQPLDVGYCRADSEDAIIEVEYIEGAGLANLSMGIRAYVG